MLLTAQFLCVLWLQSSPPQEPPELKVGEELRGVIDEKTEVVESAALARRFGEGAIRR
jgi:hypothetical protein